MLNQEQALTEMRKDVLNVLTELSSSLDNVNGCSIVVSRDEGDKTVTTNHLFVTNPITLAKFAEYSVQTALSIIGQLAEFDEDLKDSIDIDALQNAVVQLKGCQKTLAFNLFLNTILSEDDDETE